MARRAGLGQKRLARSAWPEALGDGARHHRIRALRIIWWLEPNGGCVSTYNTQLRGHDRQAMEPQAIEPETSGPIEPAAGASFASRPSSRSWGRWADAIRP